MTHLVTRNHSRSLTPLKRKKRTHEFQSLWKILSVRKIHPCTPNEKNHVYFFFFHWKKSHTLEENVKNYRSIRPSQMYTHSEVPYNEKCKKKHRVCLSVDYEMIKYGEWMSSFISFCFYCWTIQTQTVSCKELKLLNALLPKRNH